MPFENVAEALLDELVVRFPLGFRPEIVWKKLRVSAGLAYYRKGVIGLSSVVLTTEASVRETLTHEYAHLLAVHRYGTKGAGHGAAWKQAMLDLGAEPTVRHCYAVQRNATRQKVTYKCVRCGKLIERSRRLPRKRRYVHRDCGGDIRFVTIARP